MRQNLTKTYLANENKSPICLTWIQITEALVGSLNYMHLGKETYFTLFEKAFNKNPLQIGLS